MGLEKEVEEGLQQAEGPTEEGRWLVLAAVRQELRGCLMRLAEREERR